MKRLSFKRLSFDRTNIYLAVTLVLSILFTGNAAASRVEQCIYKGTVKALTLYEMEAGKNHHYQNQVLDMVVEASMTLWGSHRKCEKKIGEVIPVDLYGSEANVKVAEGQSIVIQYQYYEYVCDKPKVGACSKHKYFVIDTSHWEP